MKTDCRLLQVCKKKLNEAYVFSTLINGRLNVFEFILGERELLDSQSLFDATTPDET